jgi:hypothetical protein
MAAGEGLGDGAGLALADGAGDGFAGGLAGATGRATVVDFTRTWRSVDFQEMPVIRALDMPVLSFARRSAWFA